MPFTSDENKSLTQIHLHRQLLCYLKLHNRSSEPLSKQGLCNGLAFLAGYYVSCQKEDEFYAILNTIATWDGQHDSLYDTTFTQTFSGNYRHLGDLLEQWINDIAWFQHNTYIKNFSFFSQHEVKQQLNISSNFHYTELFNFAFTMTKDQLTCFLSYAGQFKQLQIFFRGSGHACFAHVTDKQQFQYYDPNAPLRTPIIHSATALASHIQLTKYSLFDDDAVNMDIVIVGFTLNAEAAQTFPHLDNNDIYTFLTKNCAFIANDQINMNLISRSIAYAANNSPSSLKAILQYVQHDVGIVTQALGIAMRAGNIACCLAIVNSGYHTYHFTHIGTANYLNEVPEHLKIKASKIAYLIKAYQTIPTQPRDALYHTIATAIERNDPHYCAYLLEQFDLSSESLDSLLAIAVFLENEQITAILLHKQITFIHPTLKEFAYRFNNTLLAQLLENTACSQHAANHRQLPR